jgi:hypothetical protein
MIRSRRFPRRRFFQTAAVAAVVGTSESVVSAEPPDSKKAVAKPEDVGTIDAILAAVYEVISGPAGKARDWARMRTLFAPEARLIPCLPRNADGKSAIRVLTVEDYISRAGPALEKKGFFERELARKADRFGHVAQVFSTYESREAPDAEPFQRGINSFQLFWDENRWWVVTIFWDAESPANPIPPEYRGKASRD